MNSRVLSLHTVVELEDCTSSCYRFILAATPHIRYTASCVGKMATNSTRSAIAKEIEDSNIQDVRLVSSYNRMKNKLRKYLHIHT